MEQEQLYGIDKESVETIVKQLPAPVRSFFASGKTREVTKRILQNYNLHIDQAGAVERAIVLLLLGISSPDEFIETLSKEAHLDDATVSSIVDSVNKEIFVPLQQEVRDESKGQVETSAGKEGTETQPPSQPAEHQSEMLPPKAALPQVKPSPATVSAAVSPRPQTPPLAPQQPPAQVTTTPPSPKLPQPPTPESSINKLAGWRSDAPAQSAPTPPTTPSTQPASPAQPPETPNPPVTPTNNQIPEHESPARTAPPPPNLPGTPSQSQATPAGPQEAPPAPPIVKSYAVDPYREPIDDGS